MTHPFEDDELRGRIDTSLQSSIAEVLHEHGLITTAEDVSDFETEYTPIESTETASLNIRMILPTDVTPSDESSEEE